MVLGIGEGSIELNLEKLQYHPGETIKGKAKLSLSAPKDARGLRAEFFGEKKQTRSEGHGGSHHHHTSTARVHEQKKDLGGQRAYSSGEEFSFEFPIPAEILPPKQEGIVGAVLGLFQPQVDWFVQVSLDLPMSFDVSKKVQISLTRE